MDFKKIFTGLKIATTLMENKGKVDQNVVMTAVFDRRMSDPTSYFDTFQSLYLCSHRDYPALHHCQTLSFPSGNNKLMGYLYRPTGISKGLIIYVHGIGGSAFDWYAIGIAEWLRRDYTVLAIELTASGHSEGLGIPSLSQSAFDVAAAVNYVQSRVDLKGMPLFLFGHSWGGYGVTGALSLTKGVSACAELSGFASPLDEMMGLPAAKLGGVVPGDPKVLEDALIQRAGPNGNYSAITGLEKSGVPIFCVHGDKDAMVPYRKADIASKAKGLRNAVIRILRGRDHVDVFFSDASVSARQKALEKVNVYTKEYGKSLAKIPPAALEIIQKEFDRFACSEINMPLFDEIDAFFQKHA